MADDPRDWRDGGQPAPGYPERSVLRPSGEADLPAATQAYRSSLPPRRPAQPVLPPPPTRGRRFARVLSWIAIVCSVSVLAVAGAGYALVRHYDGNIQRLSKVLPGGSNRPAAAPRNAENFLLVGSDTRGDLKAGTGVQGTGKNFVKGQRSDTVILAHLYGGNSRQAQLISFPRDSYVTIPSHVNPVDGKVVPAQKGKLNLSFQLGGPSLLIATIEQLSQVRIDHYVQIDFEGFKGMVDKLGGIDVCLPKAAKEHDSGIDLPAGRSHVMGDQALAFVRQRKKLPNGDLDRIARQQQFVGAVIRKVLSAGTLANPLRLNGFLNVATSSLQVDDQLQVSDLRDLALRFRSFNAGGVSFATIPVATINGSRKNAAGQYESVVLLDPVKDQQLFQAVRDDVAPGAPAATPTAPASKLVVPPSRVRVEVLNGAGVAGLGRRAFTDLREVGFAVLGTPGNEGTGAAQTVIRYGSDRADSARTLAAAVPGAVLQLDPTLTSGKLQLLVGSSYAGAKPVTVVGTPVRTTSPRASASPEVKTAAVDPCAA